MFPPNPVKALKWLMSVRFLWSVQVPYTVLAVVTWFFLQPALERCVEFRADWILQMFVRNLGLMVLVAGGLHLYFYTFKRQGTRRKFDPRDLTRDPPQVFWAQPGLGQHLLELCKRGDALDGLRSGVHVGLRQ